MPVTWRHSAASAILRGYPLVSGYGKIANSGLLNRLAPPSADFVWTRSIGGQIQVPLNDHVGRAIYFFGDLDPKLTWVIKRLVKPGDIAFDVGANLGLITLFMSKLVGSKGSIHAFEPNPELCKVLELTYAQNADSNITLHQTALGSASGEAVLNVPSGNFGAASVVRNNHNVQSQYRVGIATIDDIVERDAIAQLGFIKIDVEGFELEVLRGAEKTLRRLRPVVLFESNEPKSNEPRTTVMNFLSSLDYRFIAIARSLFRVKTQLVDINSSGEISGHDIVAVPDDSRFEPIRSALNAS